MFCSLLQEHLEFRFPGSFVEGDLQHLQAARNTRHRVNEQIRRIASSALGYSVSPQFGGSDITKTVPFNDAGTFDLDAQRPIINVMIISGAAIDGIK
jgi:hypothetical protein